MYLMLSKTVLWQLSSHAFKMFFPQLKLGKRNWIPRGSFALGCISEEFIWPVCHLGLQVSSPEALLGLVVESGLLEAGWGTTMRVERADDQAWGQRSASSPGVGREARGLMLLYRTQWPFYAVQPCATKYRDGRGAGAWRFEAAFKTSLAKICSWERLSRWPFELVGLGWPWGLHDIALGGFPFEFELR